MRRLKGVRQQSWGIEIYVKVSGKQFQKTLPLTATPKDIKTARALLLQEKKTLLAETTSTAIKGTLKADVEKFLKTIPEESRRYKDFSGNLQPWVARFGDQARGLLSEADAKAALFDWQGDGLQGSTLNHRRQALCSLWAHFEGPTHRCPARAIKKFKEPKGRQGFFEHHEYLKIREHITNVDYRDLFDFVYYSGWRHSEAKHLSWQEVDTIQWGVRLRRERSKNAEDRYLPLEGPLKDVIERRVAARAEGLPVFHYKRGVRRRPIGDWRKSWYNARIAAGLPDKIPHDCRRTAVRNLTRGGVPNKVAMEWTGHKTMHVFNRYNIVNENDLREAGKKLFSYINKVEDHDKPTTPAGEVS